MLASAWLLKDCMIRGLGNAQWNENGKNSEKGEYVCICLSSTFRVFASKQQTVRIMGI